MRSVAALALLGSFLGCSDKSTKRTLLDSDLDDAYVRVARPALQKFGSEKELADFFNDLASIYRAKMRDAQDSKAEGAAPAMGSAANADESITNTQHAGVDEGGIVKAHGDHLVILRRGRLFTVKIGDDSLAPIGSADAYGAGIDPNGAWYDEMLVSGDTVIVIGYSYQRGGTEVGLFDLGKDGSIKHRDTYHLRSNDYFSSRNYASRVVDGKLVFYSPMYLAVWNDDAMQTLPAMRKWYPGATDKEWKRIVAPTDIYRPLNGFTADALHTVTTCDLSARDMACSATAVMGPAGRSFYVSTDAVYIWATTWRGNARSMVVRMPLNGSAPSAIKTRGAPIDQFSFLEQDGHLNVLVRSEGAGDAMWAPEVTAGDVAMMRVPVSMFSANAPDVPNARYAQLPRPDANAYTIQNRFIGDTLLFGAGSSWGYANNANPNANKLFAYPIKGGAALVPWIRSRHRAPDFRGCGRRTA